jgi:hypothetical protein
VTHYLSNPNVKLLVGAVAAVGLAVLFVPALAHGHTARDFDYPWHDRVRDVFMLALATVAVVSVVSVFIRGTVGQRIFAVATAALPIYVLVRFVVWVLGLFRA